MTINGEQDGVKLKPGIYYVKLNFEQSSFGIPIEVSGADKQTFNLFSPEALQFKIEGKDEIDGMIMVVLSAIEFKEQNSIFFGSKKEILSSETPCGHEGRLEIKNPIPNNSVNNYLLTVYIGDEEHKKYLNLHKGVFGFLKRYSKMMFDIKEGKKISLFESEWVAEQRAESEIVYRDEKKIKSILIKTLPNNAKLYFGNLLIGKTPYELIIKGDRVFELTVRKEGYYDTYLEIDPGHLQEENLIKMEKEKPEEEIDL